MHFCFFIELLKPHHCVINLSPSLSVSLSQISGSQYKYYVIILGGGAVRAMIILITQGREGSRIGQKVIT